MNVRDLQQQTIYLGVAGSHAYGLATESSDLDVKGVLIAPTMYRSIFHTVEQCDKEHSIQEAFRDKIPSRYESACKNGLQGTVFEVRKFMKLASDSNPNLIEMLYLREDEIIFSNWQWDKIRAKRDLFLSKRARYSFSGYATSQLKRIKGHRSWLLNPVDKEPKRSDYGLPDYTLIPGDQVAAAEAAIRAKIQDWNIDYTGMLPSAVIAFQASLETYLSTLSHYDTLEEFKYKVAATEIGLSTNFIEYMLKERAYNNARTNYSSYQRWKKERNAKRAETEAKVGYDTKHAMHLVRLLRMCEEILTQGECFVYREEDRQDLLSIRNGDWSYDRLIRYAEDMEQKIESLYSVSKLQKSPNHSGIDALIEEVGAY